VSKTKSQARKEAFTAIYKNHYWGKENLSGDGSSLDATKHTREIILKVIKEHNINSIVDVACGDFVWMPLVLEKMAADFRYTGCDIVESLISAHKEKYPQYGFQSLDFVEGKIPPGEMIICRDVLQHLQVEDIKKALANFSESGAKYLLATTHIRRFGIRNRRNMKTGRCRDRNLLVAPFELPNPLVIYSEQYVGQDKFLGLWELPFC
jgi:2-polyprenyl-3-methyl-5-hydroxy-6-metoxy-1,4-benzoquinol methylase